MKLEIERAETRIAQLEKQTLSYNLPALLGKQSDYNQLDKQVPEMETYITTLEARKTELEATL